MKGQTGQILRKLWLVGAEDILKWEKRKSWKFKKQKAMCEVFVKNKDSLWA